MIEDYDDEKDDESKYGDVLLSEQEEELLFPIKAGIREFRLISSKTVLVGVLLVETEDSFLVALLSGIFDSDNGTTVEPIMSEESGFLRLFKSTVVAISYPVNSTRVAYEKYLVEMAPRYYPKVLSLLDIQAPETPDLTEKEKVEEKIKQALLNGAYFSGNDSTH